MSQASFGLSEVLDLGPAGVVGKRAVDRVVQVDEQSRRVLRGEWTTCQ
jgi:hypothetical protein